MAVHRGGSGDLSQRRRRVHAGSLRGPRNRRSPGPHERHGAGHWPVTCRRSARPLRIVVMGVLANHKGARIVASVAEAAEPGSLAIHLIGHSEKSFPEAGAGLIARDRQISGTRSGRNAAQGGTARLLVSVDRARNLQLHADRRHRIGHAHRRDRSRRVPGTPGRPAQHLAGRRDAPRKRNDGFDHVRDRLHDRGRARIPRPASAADFYDDSLPEPPRSQPDGNVAAGRSNRA